MLNTASNTDIANNDFIKDVGFDIIRNWLTKHSKCELNKHAFQSLSPTTDKEWIQISQQRTQEIINGLIRKEMLYISETPAEIGDIIENISLEGYALQEKQAEQIYRLMENLLGMGKTIKASKYPLWSMMLKNKINPNTDAKSLTFLIVVFYNFYIF